MNRNVLHLPPDPAHSVHAHARYKISSWCMLERLRLDAQKQTHKARLYSDAITFLRGVLYLHISTQREERQPGPSYSSYRLYKVRVGEDGALNGLLERRGPGTTQSGLSCCFETKAWRGLEMSEIYL